MPEERPETSYEAAGVSIAAGERAVGLIREAVSATHGPEVIPSPGGFAGLYSLTDVRDPVLASTIDGVGTKVLVARELGEYGSLGLDLVNHCANDVLSTGARPRIFLDYIASGKLDPETVAEVVRGAARACEHLGMALVGGETAEMPGVYTAGALDVVGACIGAAGREETITGGEVRAGDAILGLASSGLHTNGYTLARKVVSDAGLSYTDIPEGLERSVGELYLEPHRAYVGEILALRTAVGVRGLAHITGGGLPGNLPRTLGSSALGARLSAGSWDEPGVFGFIRETGGVAEGEMRRVFNLGVGFCAVVPPESAEEGLSVLRETGCTAWTIGEVVDNGGDVEFV